MHPLCCPSLLGQPQIGGLHDKHLLLSVLEAGSPRSRGAAELVPGEVSLSGSQDTFPLRPHSHGLSAA